MKIQLAKKQRLALLIILQYTFVLLMVIFTLYPVLYVVIGSLKTNVELTRGGGFFPKKMQFRNYLQAFQHNNFIRYTINSVIVSAGVLVLAVFTTSLAGYTFARKEFYGKRILLFLYASLLFVSMGSVTLYPTYTVLRTLGISKSLLGLILALVGAQITNVMLVMGYTKTVPRELDEAATIDGCSHYGVFFRIVFPLLKPILAIVALFSFRTAWNDYLTSYIVSIFTPSIKTLTVAVVQLKYSINAAAEWHIMLAGASIAIIPILILYVFTNKQFISGLTAGAVKG